MNNNVTSHEKKILLIVMTIAKRMKDILSVFTGFSPTIKFGSWSRH